MLHTTGDPVPLLFDTDPGVDDAMALALLARHPRVRLLGITTVFGNAALEVTTRNALWLAGRLGLEVPVAAGAPRPLQRQPRGPAVDVHGDDGLGNLDEPISPARRADTRPAHRLIVDTLRRHPGEVTLLAVGPLTNLALALAEDPAIVHLVKQVVVMGGAFGTGGHHGNVSPVAEANVACDPHAADAVFTAPWPVTVVGLDVTHQVLMDHGAFERLRRQGGREGELLWRASRHYVDFYRRELGVDGCYVHDASAVACALAPSLFGTRAGPLRVATEGIAAGQTIQSHGGRQWTEGQAWAGLPDQRVCVDVQAAPVLDLVLGTLAR